MPPNALSALDSLDSQEVESVTVTLRSGETLVFRAPWSPSRPSDSNRPVEAKGVFRHHTNADQRPATHREDGKAREWDVWEIHLSGRERLARG